MAKLRMPFWAYFGSTIEEAKKVVWPSRDMVIRHTILVLASVAVAVVIFAGVDYGLQKLVILAIER